VDVEVVPHEDVGRAELMVCGDEQVAVVGAGQTASAAALVIEMPLGPADQP
jgi:lysine/ornithine N-monooxygenase